VQLNKQINITQPFYFISCNLSFLTIIPVLDTAYLNNSGITLNILFLILLCGMWAVLQ